MTRSLTDWRRAVERRGVAGGVAAAAPRGGTARGVAPPPPPLSAPPAPAAGAMTAGVVAPAPTTFAAPAAAPADAADPGLKVLLKASGFFENKRYDWAAEQYEAFLKAYPAHAEAANARYALALCYYNQND